MKTKQAVTSTPKVEVISHTDGRVWIRRNGIVIFPPREENNLHFSTEQMAKKLYRQIGGTITQAAAIINGNGRIIMTHPQFVRPYSRA